MTLIGPAAAIGCYTDAGVERQVLAIIRPDASTLLLDTRGGSLTDARLVAHLSPDEPRENAALLGRMYLSDPTRGQCRRLHEEDLAERSTSAALSAGTADGAPLPALIETSDASYAIRPLALGADRPELRWTRSSPTEVEPPAQLTLREVVGTLEQYEPARAMTARAIAGPVPEDTAVCRLTLEFTRLLRSPVVLNRRLREAVARRVLTGQSMSEIAIRCGRFKHDQRGCKSGETSWLARRIGQMPEGGQARPTPWIHSDTLALIARAGLGLSPHEVEL